MSLQAELKVLSASQSLSRASSSPLIERRHAHSSDLSPDLDSSPDRELSRTRHSNDDGGLASTAGTPDHHQQPGSLYDSDVSTPAFVQAELNEQTQALHGIWQQLIAQQRLNGALGENMSQGPASDTQSTGSSHGLTTGSHQEAPVTPSVPLPSTSYGNTNTHLTFDYGTEMLNPLWNPDSAAESVGSRTIPQASASPSSGWQTVSDADIDGTQHTANGFGDAQPSEPPASSEEQASSSSQDAEEHMSEASSAHNPANGLDAGQPQQQAASTDTGTADLYPQTAGRDIYAEAQTQLNKDAAEAFFVKGKEAVQKRDWPRAVSHVTCIRKYYKAPDIDQKAGTCFTCIAWLV